MQQFRDSKNKQKRSKKYLLDQPITSISEKQKIFKSDKSKNRKKNNYTVTLSDKLRILYMRWPGHGCEEDT